MLARISKLRKKDERRGPEENGTARREQFIIPAPEEEAPPLTRVSIEPGPDLCMGSTCVCVCVCARAQCYDFSVSLNSVFDNYP